MPPDAWGEPVLSPRAEAAQSLGPPDAPLTNRPQMPAQSLEKAQSAPGNSTMPDASYEALTVAAGPIAVTDRDPAPAADAARLAGGPAEEASLVVEAAPPAPLIAANVLLPPHARRQPGPTAFTGLIRCGGSVTYYQ